MEHLFPIYVKLNAKKCLIIGGGKVAERKVENLMECGASITVISPQAEKKIKQWSLEGSITWIERKFCDSDLDDVFMVFLCTGDQEVDKHVVALCRKRGILINAVDDPPNCDFYVPSVIRRQSLSVAISTEGKSPMLARKIRKELENIITEEYGEFVEILGKQRQSILTRVNDIEQRKEIFESLVYSDILELLKSGEREKVRERIEQCMSCLRD